MGRCGQREKVGRFVGQRGEDEGVNKNKVRENILSITPPPPLADSCLLPWMVTCSGRYCPTLCITPTAPIPILITIPIPIPILSSSQITTQKIHEGVGGGLYSIYFLKLCFFVRLHPHLLDLQTSPPFRVGRTFPCHHHLL